MAGVNCPGRVIDKNFPVAGQADAMMRRTHEIGGRRRRAWIRCGIAGGGLSGSDGGCVSSPEVAISLNTARLTLIRTPSGGVRRRGASFGLRQARAALTRAAVAKSGRTRPDSYKGRKLGDRPFRLGGFLRRPRLGGGEPASQDLVLGLEGFDMGFEDADER